MTLEELLKNQQTLGQSGASQYLSMPQQQYGGVGQYLGGGLLSMPLNFNAPSGTMPNYSNQTYQPTQWEGPSKMYQFGNMLYTSGHPLFRLLGEDMMSKNPKTQWTFTPN
jgi:hypothetical protein